MIYLVAHLIACGFHKIAIYEKELETEQLSWLETFQLDQKSLSEKYIHSIYFAFITMITIGYGI